MPLFKTIKPNSEITIFIWKIEETLEELQKGIILTEKNKQRFDKMKSLQHKKEFIAIRQLLKVSDYQDSDIIYDEFGKPHLKDGKFVSITHSFEFCGLIISEKTPVGIDIEKQREKIIRVASKFTSVENYQNLSNSDLIKKLTIVWGAKESLYKIYGRKQLSFYDIFVEDFDLKDEKSIGKIYDKGNYQIHFFDIDNFICVYVF